MAASGDRVRLDIGLEGGSTLTVAVTVLEADSLEERLRKGDSGVAELEAGRSGGGLHAAIREARDAAERIAVAYRSIFDRRCFTTPRCAVRTFTFPE